LLNGLRIAKEFENFKWPFNITLLCIAQGKIYFHCRESYYNAGNMSGCSRMKNPGLQAAPTGLD